MRMRNLLKFLAFPIIVGIVIVLAGFLIDRYKTMRKVSAIIEGPFAFAQIHELFDKAQMSFTFKWAGKDLPKPKQEDTNPLQVEPPQTQPAKPGLPTAPGSPKVTVESVERTFDELHVYKVTIRNTGNSPIRDLPIRPVFEGASGRFQLLAAKHKTNPEREFGEIKEDFSEVSSPRFVYQLLNPGDEDVITFLATEKRDLKVYSKGEGVSFDVASVSENRAGNWFMAITLSAFAGVILGMITTFLSRFFGVNLRA